jgi:hypothetical protein
LQNRATLGILYLCLGILIFSLQDAIIKAVSGDYPLTEVVSTRCFVSAPILLALVHVETGLKALFSREFWPLVGRALLMLLAYTSYYMAFPALPLADAVALYFTVPLFTLALASPMLGEAIGWRRITAVAVGFAGVMIMLRPGSGLFEPAALLSLFSALTYALAMLLARRMGTETSASVMAFYHLPEHRLPRRRTGDRRPLPVRRRPPRGPQVDRLPDPRLGVAGPQGFPADRLLRRDRRHCDDVAHPSLPHRQGERGHQLRIYRHALGAALGFPVLR